MWNWSYASASPWYDMRENVIEIVIETGITTIGNNVFACCENLESISLPDSVATIGRFAFSQCNSLTEIYIPSGVTTIGDYAFNSCLSLESIEISENNNYYASYDGALFNKDKTTLIQYPGGKYGNYVVPDSVKVIFHSAFAYCNRTYLTIPKTVKTIESFAFGHFGNYGRGQIIFEGNAPVIEPDEDMGYDQFYDASTTIYYPFSDTTWTEFVNKFTSNRITWIEYNDNIKLKYDELSIVEGSTEYITFEVLKDDSIIEFISDDPDIASVDEEGNVTGVASGETYITVTFLSGWTEKVQVTVEEKQRSGEYAGLQWNYENGVLTISGSGYLGYELKSGYNTYKEDIVKVVIKEGVTSMIAGAFSDYHKIKEVELPESLTQIPQYAFSGCSDLAEVTIPSGVTAIMDMAFSSCTNLKRITFEGDAPYFWLGEAGYKAQFNAVTADAFYPAAKDSWTEEVMQDYGGTITWTPVGPAKGSVKAENITLKVDTKDLQSAKIEITENLSGGVLSYASDNKNVTVDTQGNVRVASGFAGTAMITIKSASSESYTEASTTISVSVLFSDVADPDTQFFYDYVYWAANNNITTGYSDNTFRPNSNCNRAAVVTFLWRLAGKPEPPKMASFKDMTGNDDFDTAISWAALEGITTGYDDGTFRPWATCNRAAIVTFLWRYAGKPTPSKTAMFKDMTKNSDFDKAISWAAEKGITTGFNDNTFRPWNQCLRLAIVSFLYRYANL